MTTLPAPDGPTTRVPRIGVSVALWRDGAVLLVKRSQPPYAGRWSLPGGRVEFGEGLRDAARRELLEETGVAAEIGESLATFEMILPDDDPPAHFVLIVFAAEYLRGSVAAGDDAADAGWFDIEALERTALTPETAKLLAGDRPR